MSVIQTFEDVSGLHLCLRAFRPGLRQSFARHLDGKNMLHIHEFCDHVKKKNELACVRCDCKDVYEDSLGREEVFTRRCHAGATEILLPLHHLEQLVAVAFLGPFQRGDGDSLLPEIRGKKLEMVLNLATVLRSHLELFIDACIHEASEDSDGRAERIRSFLERELANNPELADLGRHLGVSASRAGHLVKEWTGFSFRHLKEEKRLERACDYLRGGALKIAQIAPACGIQDLSYFYRYFKSKMGMTPAAYRCRYSLSEEA